MRDNILYGGSILDEVKLMTDLVNEIYTDGQCRLLQAQLITKFNKPLNNKTVNRLKSCNKEELKKLYLNIFTIESEDDIDEILK